MWGLHGIALCSRCGLFVVALLSHCASPHKSLPSGNPFVVFQVEHKILVLWNFVGGIVTKNRASQCYVGFAIGPFRRI